MKTPKKWFLAVLLLAIIAPACSGDDTSIGEPDKTPATSAVTTASPETVVPTAPPTIVEETTTTPAPPEFSYQLDFSALDCETVPGECTGEFPADFPVEAQNPKHPGSTLGELMALEEGSAVCVHTSDQDLPGNIGGGGVAIKSFGGGNPYLALHVVDPAEQTFWLDVVLYGVSPAPNGLDWDDEKYITAGNC